MKQEDLRDLERVRATFRPLRTDDLRYGAEKFIGVRCIWRQGWTIEDGEYEGQTAMSPWGIKDENAPAWVPFCDLAEMELVPYEEWYSETKLDTSTET